MKRLNEYTLKGDILIRNLKRYRNVSIVISLFLISRFLNLK
jgi:hypothetical protein